MDIMHPFYQLFGAVIVLFSISGFVWCYLNSPREQEEHAEWQPNYIAPRPKVEFKPCLNIFPKEEKRDVA